MKELKILIVLGVFTAALYLGVETYAHKVFHPPVAPADFTFPDLHSEATASGEVEQARNEILSLIENADAQAGRAAVEMHCAACHTVKSAGIEMMSDEQLISANGLLPPDLSNASSLYDEVFLMNFIKDPANASFIASHTLHQREELAAAKAAEPARSDELIDNHVRTVDGFNNRVHGFFNKMPGYAWLGDEEIANILAFLRTTATPLSQITPRDATINACARCHSIDYDGVELAADMDALEAYLGVRPPDLSTMILSHKEKYLTTFINDPQKHLLGTAMPRVGLNEPAQEKVIAYLEEVGDPNIENRNTLGVWFIGYFILLTILAYLWKKREFKEIGK
jgi:ubiquinol-cytochrome c reductase cytochrome c1 subunit